MRLAREILRKNKTNEAGLALPDVKTYYGSTITFKVQYWKRTRRPVQPREQKSVETYVGSQHVGERNRRHFISEKRGVLVKAGY